jgi:hypothetical protein
LVVAALEATDSRDAAAARGLRVLFVSASERDPAEEEAGGSGARRGVGSSIGRAVLAWVRKYTTSGP